MTWICQLSRRWDPSKGGVKCLEPPCSREKHLETIFLQNIHGCPYKLVTCNQNASKKVQDLLKRAVSAGRQSHPRNEEQAGSKSHMDFSGSDLRAILNLTFFRNHYFACSQVLPLASRFSKLFLFSLYDLSFPCRCFFSASMGISMGK